MSIFDLHTRHIFLLHADSVTRRFVYPLLQRARYQDAFDYDGSDRNSVCVRFDCDTTMIRLYDEKLACWKQARAIRRSRIVVESQL